MRQASKRTFSMLFVLMFLLSQNVFLLAFADDNEPYDNSCVFVGIKHEYSKIETSFKSSDFDNDLVSDVEDAMPLSEETFDEKSQNLLRLNLAEPDNLNVERLISRLEHNEIIDFVSKNVIHEFPIEEAKSVAPPDRLTMNRVAQSGPPSSLVIPSDPFVSQYAYDSISAKRAWGISNSSNVLVGVVDSGIDASHPDLAHNVNVALSKNFTDDNQGIIDQTNHGTHVAGIIGSCGNNSIGTAGVCWNANIVSLKVFKLNGSSEYSSDLWLVDAIRYAAQNNIKILNISASYGTSISTRLTLSLAINSYPGLVIASAGNSSSLTIPYPAGLSCDNIISVAAIDSNNNLCDFSNRNYTSVDLGAPGDDIISSTPNNTYSYMQGTSMAAPFVTGAAALIKSINPSYTTAQIKDCILSNTDMIQPLISCTTSGGKLNIFKAALDAGGYLMGDIDLDRTITASDARTILRISARLESYTPLQGVLADYDLDDYITSTDARTVLRISANLQ